MSNIFILHLRKGHSQPVTDLGVTDSNFDM
jgi:hypothetical protein